MKSKYRILCLFALWCIAPALLYAQNKADTISKDSTKHLAEVTVRAYLGSRPLFKTPASVAVLSATQWSFQPENSLVSAMNTVPGVRMEERSPGSYRLSIRGSVLRSPFGVRDVKIYFDELPLTDAGGNTYLNAIDVSSVQGIEVLKGPDGSLFGANSGGVVLINPVNSHADSNYVGAGISKGSFGLLHQTSAIQNQWGNYRLNINQAYESYDGYRQNSTMLRNYLQLVNTLQYGHDNTLKALGFYSELNYQTPGGLTLAQEEADPQSARLATKTTASAISLKAAVYSKILFGGIVNEWHLSSTLRNVFTVYGTHVDFTNPTFTAYEHRDENTYGLRNYFELSGKPIINIKWKAYLGFEWQQTNSTIADYGNIGGSPDTTQTQDNIRTNQNFAFSRVTAAIGSKFDIEAALSLNNYNYQFENVYPLAQNSFTNRPFNASLMPRLALTYLLNNDLAWRASVSRGYSTPTIAEVRSTNHIINPTLAPEDGFNYETGLRFKDHQERLFADVSVFYYRLNNSIVMRNNPDGTSYFVNAGGTDQPGLEVYAAYHVIPQNSSDWLRGLVLAESYTYSHFTFRDYADATTNYSGNSLTGVPRQVSILSANLSFPANLYLFIQYNYTSSIPLTDANTVYAGAYHLLEAKAGWQWHIYRSYTASVYAGAGNLLNQRYSLGDDINAALARYYNPAPPRNYYAGLNLRF